MCPNSFCLSYETYIFTVENLLFIHAYNTFILCDDFNLPGDL